jgi:hypothetical protein
MAEERLRRRLDVHDGVEVRRAIAVSTMVVALLAGAARPDDPKPPLAPPFVLEEIARAGLDLAKRGRRAESDELVAVFAEMDGPAADVVSLRDKTAKALATAKTAPLPQTDVAKSLTKLSADLAKAIGLLATLDADAAKKLARLALRVDSDIDAAHEAVGDVKSDGAWIPAARAATLARHAEIAAAVDAARRLDVPVVAGESPLSVLEAVHGEKGAVARCGKLAFHSGDYSAAQLARQLRQAMRSAALSNFILNGTLAVPDSGALVVVLFRTKDGYARALDAARKSGDLDPKDYETALKYRSYHTKTCELSRASGESAVGCEAYRHVFNGTPCGGGKRGATTAGTQACLRAGHINWVRTMVLGFPEPDSGSRACARWMAREGRDPPWSASMLEQVGDVQRTALMKATSVVEFLQETSEFATLLTSTRGAVASPKTFESAMGRPLSAFEERWRAWILADSPTRGLLQRLSVTPGDAAAPCVARLDDIRRRALGADAAPLAVDAELSAACHAHRVYLDRHPTQREVWPGCHEEYPDVDDFTPEGNRAGHSSVISTGPTRPDDAVDLWIATFYHRLDLLTPGLGRIGWDMEKDLAVLDASSVVAPPPKPSWVAWPPVGGKDVPRRFGYTEMPSPVPDADQSQWGYPVTLQFFGCAAEADVRMHLFVGTKRGGAELPCHFSTPSAPTNPLLAPAGAFCLIPKQTLAPNATYAVAVDGWPADARGADWTFTTGAK